MHKKEPSIIYGTAWKEEKTAHLVELALQAGFRAIDTANQRKHYYEEAVGFGLQEAYKKFEIARNDVFLQTKFTFARGQDHRKPYDESDPLDVQVKSSFQSSLEHLQTDTIDSFVLHGPYTGMKLVEQDEIVWRAMEGLVEEGSVRQLGVSNINLLQLQQLVEWAKIKPSYVQNRCFAQTRWDKAIRDYCQGRGIVYQGFSLLTANQRELSRPSLYTMSERYDRTVAELVFAFARQSGMLPLTGTTSTVHMEQDLVSVDLLLLPEDFAFIENIAFS